MSEQPILKRVRAWEVVVPARPGHADSPALGSFMSGEAWDRMPIVLVEFTFSDGIVGLGEVTRGHSLKMLHDHLCALLGRSFSGTAPVDQPREWKPVPFAGLVSLMPAPACRSTSAVAGALEIALLDAAGQRMQCRVVDLLGGAVRDRVMVDYWCGRQTPTDLEATIGRAIEAGFTGIKMKSRLGDPLHEQIEMIRRCSGADFSVTVDPMFQWLTPSHVLPMLKAVEAIGGLIKIEDPFPQDQPKMWRRLRDAVGLPLIWHARDEVSFRRGLQCGAVDGFNASAGICWGFLHQAHTLEALGVPCWHGSAIELGVAQAARLHACAAAPACVWPSDLVGPLVREHHLTTWHWPYAQGSLPLPDAPGLGLQLDEHQLKRYCTAEVQLEA